MNNLNTLYVKSKHRANELLKSEYEQFKYIIC